MTFYFPLMTCLLLSALFSLVFWVVNAETAIAHRAECPRAVLPADAARERFGADPARRLDGQAAGGREEGPLRLHRRPRAHRDVPRGARLPLRREGCDQLRPE